ncbi:uncharacterized protein LOC122072757 [Macadamia integrifolia]|uniref:uncharacterized protein LOC122072757 n=1 Tax=Macadamia integrifolia TaxID=60698 RepID=UPI001C4E9F11|nr:uncharacterized protein LOC122072757 [Macadamia integrifolia]
MGYGRKSQISSALEVFALNPLPYRVLLILGLVSIFLGISWYSSYESAVEKTQEQMSLVLIITPLILLIVVRWLSSMENPDFLFLSDDRRRMKTHHLPAEGSSPWGVAALIVVLLIMISYQSTFHDSWFI